MDDAMDREDGGWGLASGRFVGRDAQLDLLTERLTDGASSSRTVLVHGDPGIGKTRLLAELGMRMTGQGWRVVWGRSWDEGGTPPYWLWTQVTRDLRGRSQGTELAPIVLDEPDGTDRLALFDATAALLRRAALRRPVLVLLDDLHAADVPSLLLARFVAEQLAGVQVGLIGTYRPREADARPEVRSHLDRFARLGDDLHLRGLDVEAVAELLGTGFHAGDVCEVTGGNPLFIEQVVRSDDVHNPVSTTSDTRTSDALLAAITARIDALAPGPRRTLVAAAVLGGSADPESLARLLGVDLGEVEADLGALATDGLVDRAAVGPQPTLHALVADAALAVVGEAEVTRLHRAAVDAIASEERPGELAHHLLRAGPEHRREAAEACRRAGEAAMSATAYEDAAVHYERALQTLEASPGSEADDDGRCLGVLLELGYALRVAGRVGPADAVFDQALALADALDDPERRALAALRGGVQYFFAADRSTPRDEQCRAALDALPPGDSALRARLVADLATQSGVSTASGRALADEAVAMARRVGEPVALGNALVAQQVTAMGPDTLARRLVTAHEILTLARAASDLPLDVQGRYLLYGAMVERGDLRGFDDGLASGGDGSDDLADRHRARLAGWHAFVRATFAGGLDLAEGVAERGLAAALASDDTAAWRVYGAQIGVVRWLQDRSAEMEPLFEAQWRAKPNDPVWPAALGYVRATQGRHDEARAVLRDLDLDQVPPGMSWLLTMVLFAEAAVAVQDDSAAAAVRTKLLPFAERFVPVNVGAAAWGTVARPLGLVARHLGRMDEAITQLGRAVEVCARMGARPWLVQSQVDLAETLVLAGHDDDPRMDQLLEDASTTAAELGLSRFAERAAELRPGVRRSGIRTDVEPPGPPMVSVLGAFEVTSPDGRVAHWTSRKARDLLKILVANRGAPVHREVLMDLLWPGTEVTALGNRLSVALSTVRRALDPDRSRPADELITTDRSSIRLRTDRVTVDAEQFLTAAGEALAVHAAGGDGALDLLLGAMKLHRGPALPDEPYADWASSFRSEVWTAHLRLARSLADRAIADGQDLVALDALRRIADSDPLDEASGAEFARMLERAVRLDGWRPAEGGVASLPGRQRQA